MRIQRLDEQMVALEELDPFCCDLLRQIPTSADPTGSREAEERLFTTPTHGAEPEADADWKEYVEPGMRELFLDAVGVVQSDLEHLVGSEPGEHQTLRLPVEHLEAWINALNQARLALSARHGFTELELERDIPMEGNARALAIFQVHFYGLLQEFFLRQLD
ncbi:MAG: hypothetical protein QOE70_2194 [Chthoniobacter sp.]|jgi:hypothetical protein|nr:hypothetical protein [Chthoniobacter sp.]